MNRPTRLLNATAEPKSSTPLILQSAQFRNTAKGCLSHVQLSSRKTTPCRLSTSGNSIYSQLRCIHGGSLLRTHHALGLYLTLFNDVISTANALCITSAFGDEPRRMLSINQRFGNHCSCHLRGEYVVGRVLEALYRAGSRRRVTFDGADWWSCWQAGGFRKHSYPCA
jgi:hypothetical protein